MSDNNKLYEALCKFQSVMETVEQTRDGYNYKYANLADVWEAIREPLTANDLCVIQLIQTDDNGMNHLITKLCHTSGETVESKTLMVFNAKKFTEVGTAYTYYRRYALSAMLGIVSDKDVDARSEQQEQVYEEQKIEKVSPAEIQSLVRLVGDDQDLQDRILDSVPGRDLKNMTSVQYGKLIKSLAKKK